MNHATTLIILTALMMPIDAVAASPASEVTAVTAADAVTNLVVDVDASVPNASAVRRRVEVSARGALASVKSYRAAGDRVLVHVTGEQYEYSVRVSAMRLDVTLEESTVGCECNTAELSERVSAEVTRVAARFSEATKEPGITMQAEPTTQVKPPTLEKPQTMLRKPTLGHAKPSPAAGLEPVTRTSEPVIVPPKPRRTRAAGVATLVAGSALLFVGAGMMAAGSTELVDQWQHYQRDWRPLGFTLGGVGLAGIGIGGSLMLFEEIRCRRRPDSCASSRRYAKRLNLQ